MSIISYENEVIGAQQAGEELDLITPDDTIQIDTIVDADRGWRRDRNGVHRLPLTRRRDRHCSPRMAIGPLDEKVFAEFEDEFPEPSGLFTIEEFGGWGDRRHGLLRPRGPRQDR